MRTVFLLTIAACLNAQNAAPLPAAGNVSLSLDQYNRLIELAATQPKRPETPPFPYILKSAQINLEVQGETVSGTMQLDGEVFAKGERKVPLVRGLIVLDAQQQGHELPLEQEAGIHSALLSGPAEFSLTLNAGLPLTIDTGKASFDLPAPSAGAVRLTLTLPGEQTQVNLSPGLITARSSANGRTTIEATLVPGQNANLWWASRFAPPPPPAAPKEVRFLSDIKTLISVSEAELSVAALAEITVIQGEPAKFEVQAPDGYELTGATGATLISSDVKGKTIILEVSDPAARSHQFLLSLVRANMSPKVEIPLVTFQGAQRETGEVLVEADGAIELSATERAGLRRMDIKEVSPYLSSLSRAQLHAAFRYQKKSDTPAVALEWTRFPDSSVLSAVAQSAVVTTLVTSEGRSLTEVKLTLKNQSQPFLKVALPAGASILSSEVAGQKVKPVEGADGNRVPLLRPGFRPTGPYTISFVFLHAGAPFAKKGGAELALPKMDIPIGLVQWEVFLPERYKVADFGGDAISQQILHPPPEEELPVSYLPYAPRAFAAPAPPAMPPTAGGVGGTVIDPAGAVISTAEITVKYLGSGATFHARTDANGRWMLPNIPSGRLEITVDVLGFKKYVRYVEHDVNHATQFTTTMEIGGTADSVTVSAETSLLKTESGELSRSVRLNPGANLPQITPPSSNVADFQRRVAGVLPIAVTVPRTGSAYRFIRPLVVDEETKLTFNYKSR
jgi:Carboxypeptidase regulatory-like domain